VNANIACFGSVEIVVDTLPGTESEATETPPPDPDEEAEVPPVWTVFSGNGTAVPLCDATLDLLAVLPHPAAAIDRTATLEQIARRANHE
jgi:hypothetical protein